MAFTDDKIEETGFLAIILNAAKFQRAKFRHYFNPFEIARAIQLCQCDLAWLIICKLRRSAKSFTNLRENQHYGFRKCFSRYSSHIPMTSSGFVEFYITDFWIVE